VQEFGTAPTGAGQQLGAPGPEPYLGSGQTIQRNAAFAVGLVDSGFPPSAPPNREFNSTADGDPNTRDSQGNLEVRRRITNNSNESFDTLRFRAWPITTKPAPIGTADLRLLDSQTKDVDPDVGTLTVEGLDHEDPVPLDDPEPAEDGGLNSNFVISGCGRFPNPQGEFAGDCRFDPGESMNFNFRFGVEQKGGFQFRLHIEAESREPAEVSIIVPPRP
jgi:hypothetical protein